MTTNDDRLAVFQKMAEADPTNELAHFSLGKLLLERGDAVAAEASLRRTLELSPEHAQAHRQLGEALLRQGKKDAAIAVWRAGIPLSHRKGEFQPRNQMQEALRAVGIEPPLPQGTATVVAAPVAGQAPAGAWICRRCQRANPRLEEPPFLNDLGKRIQDTICQSCWREWFAMSIKVINEYRLNLLSPQGNQIYETHLREFLGIDS